MALLDLHGNEILRGVAKEVTSGDLTDLFFQVRNVDVIPEDLFFEDAQNGGSSELNVDGSVTPVVFTINANASANDSDIVIGQLKLHGLDVKIKLQTTNFMGMTTALTNGITIEVFSNGTSFILPGVPIKTTRDLLARFSNTASENQVISQSGGDYIESTFDLIKIKAQIKLVAGSTDRIEVTVEDDLTTIDTLIFTAGGINE